MGVAGVFLHHVQCGDGNAISIGLRQVEFLVSSGHIRYALTTPQDVKLYTTEYTVDELHAITLAQPELRECDFCTASPAGWRIQCRPFRIALGPNAGARLGGPTRPVFACPSCAKFIRSNRKHELIEYAIDANLENAAAMGVDRRGHPQARATIRPFIREVALLMFSHRQGPPEED